MRVIPSNPTSYASSNSYLVEDGKEAYLIDAPEVDENFERTIMEDSLELKAILLTHGHFDHITGVKRLKERYPLIKVYMSKGDKPFIDDGGKLSYSMMREMAGYSDSSLFQGLIDIVEYYEDQKSEIGPFIIYSAKGHSKGSVLIYLEGEHVLFTGDTLFMGSCGRTDLYGGESRELSESLSFIKRNFPPDTAIYPGHGIPTTLRNELVSNPYLINAK